MEFQVTRSRSRVLSNNRRAEVREPHLEYIVMRLLTKKRSEVWPEVIIPAWMHLPRGKLEVETAVRRREKHWEGDGGRETGSKRAEKRERKQMKRQEEVGDLAEVQKIERGIRIDPKSKSISWAKKEQTQTWLPCKVHFWRQCRLSQAASIYDSVAGCFPFWLKGLSTFVSTSHFLSEEQFPRPFLQTTAASSISLAGLFCRRLAMWKWTKRTLEWRSKLTGHWTILV